MVEKDRIIRMRKEAGMKQVEFAEYFDIPVRTLQEWEHDRRTPPEYLSLYNKFRRICKETSRLSICKDTTLREIQDVL